MESYVPPYCPPCEACWEAILREGPISTGEVPGPWEWIELPSVALEIWDEARDLQDRHSTVSITVDSYNRGGLIAHWKSIECFVPASHLVAYPFPADPDTRESCFERYLGKTLRFCVIEVEPSRNRILLSERRVADCEPKHTEWPAWLCIGTVCDGIVTSVRPFGAFVDIGPLEGMVHISEISWGRVRHPQDFVAPGQSVKVRILNVDLEHQRVGLSIKRLRPNPWATVHDLLKPGDVIEGSVASVERFGLFVELLEGIEGLVHISGLGDASCRNDVQSMFTVGEAIDVRILDILPDEHRIALALATSEVENA
ncbi:MAG: S1 RNA-binding domain-containing protein [Anaerolineae bacterium]|jgi:small subunit ribosomal protein S1|nr:S1 RNA-binding domain-containing protein [Anaerolineae bacterium]